MRYGEILNLRPTIFEEIKFWHIPKFEAKPKFGTEAKVRPDQSGHAWPGFKVCQFF